MISEAIVAYSNTSDILIYGAMAAYTVALLAFAIDLARLTDRSSESGRKLAGVGQAVTWAGFFMHLGAVVLRGLAVSRVPWANMYEFAITATLVAEIGRASCRERGQRRAEVAASEKRRKDIVDGARRVRDRR